MSQPLALIVEDEQDILMVFAAALRAAGYDAETARDGDEAIAWLSSHTPDLVMLDLHLPNVSGTEVLEHIRADPRLANTSVIVATAYPRVAESLQEQTDWVFLKPISFPQLRDMAARLRPGTPADQPPGEPTDRQSEEET